jgi:hypothetical protein
MKTLTLFTVLALSLMSKNLYAKTGEFDHSHSLLQKVFNEALVIQNSRTKVNYKKLKNNKAELDSYVSEIEKVKKESYDSFTKKQKLAFLINAYNALTIKLVRDHYPVDSIKDIAGFLTSVFSKKFFKIFGVERSLSWIEHDVLRKDFKEPRIHFALNCAAISCPDLSITVYTESNLEKLLEQNAIKFINDKSRTRYDENKKELLISKIFDWFEEDFGDSDEKVKEYILNYLSVTDELKSKIKSDDTDIEYLDYDWSLNKLKN